MWTAVTLKWWQYHLLDMSQIGRLTKRKKYQHHRSYSITDQVLSKSIKSFTVHLFPSMGVFISWLSRTKLIEAVGSYTVPHFPHWTTYAFSIGILYSVALKPGHAVDLEVRNALIWYSWNNAATSSSTTVYGLNGKQKFVLWMMQCLSPSPNKPCSPSAEANQTSLFWNEINDVNIALRSKKKSGLVFVVLKNIFTNVTCIAICQSLFDQWNSRTKRIRPPPPQFSTYA